MTAYRTSRVNIKVDISLNGSNWEMIMTTFPYKNLNFVCTQNFSYPIPITRAAVISLIL